MIDDIICQLFHWKNKKSYNKIRNKDGHYSLKGYDELECIFVHIPKAAGISINKALFGNYGGGHRTAQNYKRIFGPKLFKRYYKITFVRNPYTRLLSAYEYLIQGGFYLNKKDKTWAEKNISKYGSFDEFVKKWINEENIWNYVHFMPQYYFICDSDLNSMVDFIGKVENIDEDFDKVCRKLQIKNRLYHLNKRNKKKNWKVYYSDYSLKKVYDIYKIDFNKFNYSLISDTSKKVLQNPVSS